ncbi:MAG: AsmA family protein, partial [Alphaproteobacteria bacterium]
MRKLLYGLIGLVILLVAAVFIVPAVIDWNGYKADIAQEVRAATGRDLVIDGDISVRLLPSPHASVSGIR